MASSQRELPPCSHQVREAFTLVLLSLIDVVAYGRVSRRHRCLWAWCNHWLWLSRDLSLDLSQPLNLSTSATSLSTSLNLSRPLHFSQPLLLPVACCSLFVGARPPASPLASHQTPFFKGINMSHSRHGRRKRRSRICAPVRPSPGARGAWPTIMTCDLAMANGWRRRTQQRYDSTPIYQLPPELSYVSWFIKQ